MGGAKSRFQPCHVLAACSLSEIGYELGWKKALKGKSYEEVSRRGREVSVLFPF